MQYNQSFMKKIYFLLLAVLACCLPAQADWDITLNVTKGADRVKAVVGDSDTSDNVIELTVGDNNIHIPSYESLYIIPNNETDVVVFKDCTGENIEKSWYGYYEIYASDYRDNNTPYTLTVVDESEYRDKEVRVTMDDCSKVTIIRADGTEFEPETNDITIPYNSTDEHLFTISPRSYYDMIYKVTVGGKDVEKSGSSFKADVLDNTGVEPVYAADIDVQVNFPEGLTFKTVLTLDGPAEMISYIRVNDTNVADMEAALSAAGIEAKPGETVAIGFSDEYKIESIEDNGESHYAYSQYTIDGIDCDHQISIKGHKYATFNVTFNVTGAEGVEGSLGYNKLPLQEGANELPFSEKNCYVTFSPVEGYMFTEFTDGTTDYLDTSDYKYYGKVYLDVAEGQVYTIKAEKIRRDDTIVLYMDEDMNDIEFSYFSVKFDEYTPADEVKAGYNTINFRKEDGMFSMFASGSYDGYYAYKNGELLVPSYEGAKYFEDGSVAHGDVYKVFFKEEPAVYDVTFDVIGDALEGYAVKHDLITDTDCSAAVKAVGPTRFTISPVSRDDEGITVKVNDEPVEAVDGVFTFDTTAASTVSVAGSSSIESIEAESAANGDVFNLQGIRVATDGDLSRLPAGVYIVNGKKVAVK